MRPSNASDVKGAHSGWVFILANGPSLLDHDLTLLPEPTIGINRSWKWHLSRHLVVADVDHMDELPPPATCLWGLQGRVRPTQEGWGVMLPEVRQKAREGARNPLDSPDLVKLTAASQALWSDDLDLGVACTSSVHYALQLAKWMGFDTAVVLGLDLLVGKHADTGRTFSAEAKRNQLEVFEKLRRQQSYRPMSVYTCLPSKIPYLPVLTFKAALEGARRAREVSRGPQD